MLKKNKKRKTAENSLKTHVPEQSQIAEFSLKIFSLFVCLFVFFFILLILLKLLIRIINKSIETIYCSVF